MQRRAEAVSPPTSPLVRLLGSPLAGVALAALLSSAAPACSPFERASDCRELAEAARPLEKLGTLEPTKEALGRAVLATKSVTARLTKLPKPHASLKDPKKALVKQLADLTRELESAEKAIVDDNQRAYTAARGRVLAREKGLAQSLSALTAACR